MYTAHIPMFKGIFDKEMGLLEISDVPSHFILQAFQMLYLMQELRFPAHMKRHFYPNEFP